MSEGPGGVIHDIGYRHYAGPRLGIGEITRTLYAGGLRGAYGLGRSTRSKIFPFVLLAAAVAPAVVVVVVTSVTHAQKLPISPLGYLAAITTLLALYVAIQAPAAVSRDLRFRTLTLYFSRPIARHHYVLAKYGALASAVALFAGAPLVVLYVGALLLKLPVAAATRGLLVGLAGAVLIGLVAGGISLVVAALTPRRGLGVAAVITVLIVTGGVQGSLQVLGQEQGRPALAQYSGLVDPFTLVIWLLGWLSPADGTDAPVQLTDGRGLVYLAVTVAVIALSALLLLRRYRRVSVS